MKGKTPMTSPVQTDESADAVAAANATLSKADRKAQIGARRKAIHDGFVSIVAPAIRVESETSEKLTDVYRAASPFVVDLRESFVAADRTVGWATVTAASAQYSIEVGKLYDDAVSNALPIPPQPDAPDIDASDKQRDKFRRDFERWDKETEGLRVRWQEIRNILPNRLQHHIESEMARRYGPKPKPESGGGDTTPKGRVNPVVPTDTKAQATFTAMSRGEAAPEKADLAAVALLVTRTTVSLLDAVQAAKPNGIPAQATIIGLMAQTKATAESVVQAILLGMPKAEATRLMTEAQAERERVMAAEAEARKAEAEAQAEADAKHDAAESDAAASDETTEA